MTDPYRTTYHRDGTVTVWDVYSQTWRRRVRSMPDRVWASLSERERNKAAKHLGGGR